MKKTVLVSSLIFLVPLIAFAQNLQNVQGLIGAIAQIVNAFIPILIAATVVIFFYGLFKYVRDAGEGHTTGRNIMIAGIVALFIMVSVWGIIQFAQSALGVNSNSAAQSVATPPVVPLPTY